MKDRAIVTATFVVALLAASLVAPVAPTAEAADGSPPKLFVTLRATSVNGEFRFVNERIVAGEVPTVINVTVINDDPILGTFHTFTIRSTESTTPLVDLPLAHRSSASVEFTLWGPARIAVGTRNESTEQSGGFPKFFCRPHEALGMVGRVAIGGIQEAQEPAEKGVFLRAYWIGLLGFGGTLLLVAISYFVIKGSSRHYRDHHEHIRRGGP